jgi:nitrogen fixation NifU-like protein
MDKIVELLKIPGYSSKAIEYYTKKINVGQIERPDVYSIYTGPCGDTMEIYLKIDSGLIKDAKFQATGCAGSFISGTALCNMIKGKTLDDAERLNEEDIIEHLEGLPQPEVHCACLAKKTLQKAINNKKK